MKPPTLPGLLARKSQLLPAHLRHPGSARYATTLLPLRWSPCAATYSVADALSPKFPRTSVARPANIRSWSKSRCNPSVSLTMLGISFKLASLASPAIFAIVFVLSTSRHTSWNSLDSST
ncbi:hypothetical protein PHLGIDRAFT_325785 [Phlebiopsis gigantea 11061_1 CR5-6]|uniref:Uncharacterized protein n=1 Tax=Phlebiopsis gigantea (strain 11061_1 CR5-6) TaxID=745531 RepID=A0A0C3S2H4_PHLG1|nr:hypothetical protein PHLGIDRAFT_325785 [Phlebiopsis gigantea 11061_1 CR5-6]